MIDPLALISGTDIPFRQGGLIIHQPILKEISFIGQDAFFTGCQYLNFSKQILREQDKKHLGNLNDFEILMTIIKKDDIAIKRIKTCMELVLLLLFPNYKISFLPRSIMLTRKIDQNLQRHLIDENNFQVFKEMIAQIFCLKQTKNTLKYNPGGPQARALVQKFKKRQEKLARLKSRGQQEEQSISILSHYVSILAVGQKKDMNSLLQYTVYQLFDEFQRFKRKESFDIYVQAKMAGAQDLEEIDNWMGDIHSDT